MTTQFMTNLDTYLYNFINTESKNTKKTKRELLEEIIKEYIENKKTKELEKSYKNMSQDFEYLNEMQENTKYLANL